MSPRTAHLPNALIGLLPARLQEFQHRQGNFVTRMLGRSEPGFARLEKRVGHFPKDIQLILFVSGIADSHGDRFLISRQPWQFQFGEPAFAAKAIKDVKFGRAASDRAQKPLPPLSRLF